MNEDKTISVEDAIAVLEEKEIQIPLKIGKGEIIVKVMPLSWFELALGYILFPDARKKGGVTIETFTPELRDRLLETSLKIGSVDIKIWLKERSRAIKDILFAVALKLTDFEVLGRFFALGMAAMTGESQSSPTQDEPSSISPQDGSKPDMD